MIFEGLELASDDWEEMEEYEYAFVEAALRRFDAEVSPHAQLDQARWRALLMTEKTLSGIVWRVESCELVRTSAG